MIEELMGAVRPSVLSGGCVVVWNKGVLITGASGSGKTECAFELLRRGHRFVSDDVTLVSRQATGLVAKAPETTGACAHFRDVGIIDVRTAFGNEAVAHSVPLSLGVTLVPADAQVVDDFANGPVQRELLSEMLPWYTLRTFPGRGLALAVEMAVRREMAREAGCDAVSAFLQWPAQK